MDADWRAWGPWVWALYVLGMLYAAGFLWYFFRFRRTERAARAGAAGAVVAFNRSLRGFPNAFYAKMLGRRPLDAGEGPAGGAEGPRPAPAPRRA